MENKYFILIKEIINRLDPIGLLKQGAPDDEYDDEIKKIAIGLPICNSVTDIQELVYNIFKENFGQETAGDISLYLDIAKSIFDKIKT